MKLPIPWRKPSASQPEPISQEAPGIKIDITIPRECVYKSFDDDPGPCPRCGGPLQQTYQTFMIATRRGSQITDSFITGGDMGWFCTHCPTIVIDPAEVSELLQAKLPHWDVGNQFVVLGLVNWDAVPDEKENLPIGGNDNPIPLIKFTNITRTVERGQPARESRDKKRKSVGRAYKQDKKHKKH